MRSVLVVEDDTKLARILEIQLTYQGFKIDIAKNGLEGLEMFSRKKYDIVLLDLMMPKLDGYEVCKRLKEVSDIPIIMMTARDAITDRINGLELGADDYVVKPFNYKELIARMRAVLRRTGKKSEGLISYRDLSLNLGTMEVTRNQNAIELSKQEFKLLELLMINKGIVVRRERIFEEVWGDEDGTNQNVLDVYIKYLRNKVDKDYEEKYIRTVRGVGYIIK